MEPPRVHVITLPSSPLFWVRATALVFSCVAFIVTRFAFLPPGDTIDWCLVSWMFSFIFTLSILLVELSRIKNQNPLFWSNVTITFASYAALFWLVTSITLPVLFIMNQMYSKNPNYCITATVFCYLATVAYLGEVILSKAMHKKEKGYMTTVLGLMKVFQTFVACVIIIMVSIPGSYNGCVPLQWCLAVYCICFILSMVVVVMCMWKKATPTCACLFYQSAYELLAVALYVTATILWPLYQFHKQHKSKGSESLNEIAVAVLTDLNLLIYTADLAYSIRLLKKACIL
ncbi:Myeloid-associated differentiation marker-like [Oryzias melastigma]|uniref:Myeloid-associated differentiation marker-like n=1 Tax=Oryzias melastigma TaxID=30732 RepID=A0A834CF46_ORYME|nr:Myeloid-associated differentiation marker-like [Oryzias melastigma]